MTLLVAALACIVFIWQGPALAPAEFQTLPQLLAGVFRHGNAEHLAGNLMLVTVSGLMAEHRLGSGRWLVLTLAAAAFATVAERALGGPGFIGLSGVAYGYVSAAVLLRTPAAQRITALGLIIVLLLLEWGILRDDVAVYSHIVGALTGASFTMFSNLFGPKGPVLKPMKWEHLSAAITIIAETDEDDAAEAEEILLGCDFENMFVLADRGQVLGLTGFKIDPVVPDLAWLSWTYLAHEHIGKGLGSKMFNDLLGMLKQHGVRKIFIETSDYEEDGEKIYANAHRLYEEFGARLELTLPDYHAVGEAKLIFGLDNPEAEAVDATPENREPGLALTGIDPAPEAENVAGLRWEETPTGLAGGEFALNSAKERKFRMALLAIPSDLSQAQAEGLRGLGFRHVGQLEDYYGTGLGQDWWAQDLTP